VPTDTVPSVPEVAALSGPLLVALALAVVWVALDWMYARLGVR